MTERNRTFFTMALMGFAALLLAVPATANAEHRDGRERGEALRHERGQRHEVRRHDADHRRDEARAERHRDRHPRYARHRHTGRAAKLRFAHRGWQRPYARDHAARHRHAAPYYCKPCRDGFASSDRFRSHLRHRHQVPFWRLSRVIQRVGFGWIFFG